jgi:hypothetical protein
MLIYCCRILIFFCKFEPGEPFPEVGANQGLTVILDAHNDLLEGLSVETDYEGFIASVTSPGEFPLTFQNGFKGSLTHP